MFLQLRNSSLQKVGDFFLTFVLPIDSVVSALHNIGSGFFIQYTEKRKLDFE